MPRELYEIDKGDIVSVYNRDFITEQVFRLGSGPAALNNYQLRDGIEEKWLAVRPWEAGLCVLGEVVKIDLQKPGATISHGDREYRKTNSRQGRSIGTSEMGFPRYYNIEYYDYISEDGREYLFVQKSDNNYIVFTGEAVIPSAIMIFPGTGK